MDVADIETIDRFEFLLGCYQEYSIHISDIKGKSKYLGNILELINEQMEEIIHELTHE